MSLVRIGNTSIEGTVAYERTFDPQYGIRTQITWEGDESACYAKAFLLRFQAKCRVFQHNGPVYRITALFGDAEDGGAQEALDRYEIVTEWAQLDVRNNPLLIAKVGNASLLGRIVGDINNALASKPAVDLSTYYNTLLLSPGVTVPVVTQDFLDIYELIAKGVTTFEVKRFVLRRRRSIPIDWATPVILSAVDNVYKTGTLISTFGLPAAIQAQLPPDPASKPPNTTWAWKERTDSSEQIPALNKAEEVKDWIFAAWSNFLYTVS